MTEKGSDELLAEAGVPGQVTGLEEAEQRALAAEEQRVTATAPATDEPGESHPDPDEAPPADEPHPEFDPTPPPEEE